MATTFNQKECDERHRFIKGAFATLFGLMMLFITMSGMALTKTYAVSDTINALQTTVQVEHNEGVHIKKDLEDIKCEQKEQRQLLNQIFQSVKAK